MTEDESLCVSRFFFNDDVEAVEAVDEAVDKPTW
jgi:hypothetical protein